MTMNNAHSGNVRQRGIVEKFVHRSVASSTVEPIKLISSVAAPSFAGVVRRHYLWSSALRPPVPQFKISSTPLSCAATEEINLIGSTVEEATERVDKFLDNARAGARFPSEHYSWSWDWRSAQRASDNF